MTEASTPDKARARTTSLRGRIPALSAAQADAMRKLFAAPVCWPLRDERMLCLAPPVSGKGMGGLFELEGDGSRLALRFDAAQAQRADVSLPWSDYAGRARLLAWSLAHEPALVRLSDAIGAIMPAGPGVPPMWGFYFRVADIDDAKAKVEAGGGQVLFGPMEVPGGEWVFNALDPEGVPFGVVAPGKAS